MEQKEQTIQWHPAFFAGIQIELGDEAKYFSFEAEHQLGTKPMANQIPIQILVTSQLDPSENLWLRSLTNDLHETKWQKKLIDEYQKIWEECTVSIDDGCDCAGELEKGQGGAVGNGSSL